MSAAPKQGSWLVVWSPNRYGTSFPGVGRAIAVALRLRSPCVQNASDISLPEARLKVPAVVAAERRAQRGLLGRVRRRALVAFARHALHRTQVCARLESGFRGEA